VTDSNIDDATATTEPPNVPSAPIDLVAIEQDLAAVEAALPRLDDGTYWLDEITGDELPDAVLADNPIARRA
jgi:RNA polymerase-binding transcription factor DksA